MINLTTRTQYGTVIKYTSCLHKYSSVLTELPFLDFRTRIVFSEEYSANIRERVWSEDQTIEILPDGGVELVFTVGSKCYLLS